MNSNCHIYISSCIELADINIPRIIENVKSSNIPSQYVHIVVGGASEETIQYIDNIEIIKVKYRCFEFTPHIYVCLNRDRCNFEIAFFTHDTIHFGANFYNLIQKDAKEMRAQNYQTKKIEHEWPSMNIGLYTKNVILNHNDKLMELCLYSNNRDELFQLKHKLVHYEDFILNNHNRMPSHTTHTYMQAIELESINGKKQLCRIRYYKHIDFTKYQTNHGSITTIDSPIVPT